MAAQLGFGGNAHGLNLHPTGMESQLSRRIFHRLFPVLQSSLKQIRKNSCWCGSAGRSRHNERAAVGIDREGEAMDRRYPIGKFKIDNRRRR